MPWNNSIKVVVNYATSGAEIATFEVDPAQSAQDIQQELFRLTGAPAYRQRLLHGSEVLDPRRRLQEIAREGTQSTREVSLMLIVQDVLWLATTSHDGGVKIWNVDTGEQIQTLGGHQNGVRHATFSSDGCTLLTAARDCTAKIWNTLTGEPVDIFRGHTNAVNKAIFSDDGLMVLTSSNDGTARLWYVLTGECIKVFAGHDDGVVSAAFAHDGSILTASVDRTAKVWDVRTAECIQTLKRPRGEIIVSVFSTPKQNLALSTLQDGTTKLWNIATQKCTQTLKGHRAYITNATLSRDCSLLLTASWDRSVKMWPVQAFKKTRRASMTFVGHNNGVSSAEFSADMSKVITAAADGAAKIWDAQTGECIRTIKAQGAAVNHATFSPT